MGLKLPFHSRPALGALLLCALGTVPLLGQATGRALHDSPVASKSDRRCAATHATSVAVPFQVVDLGGIPERTASLEHFRGPRVRAVVIDSATWPEVWRKTADTVPPPRIAFGSDVLLLLANESRAMGPSTLTVKWIRQCRRTGTIIVASQKNPRRSYSTAEPSRGMALVRVPRPALDSARVVFLDLPSP
jgi:hypothetical protein